VNTGPALIDAHVHIHECYEIESAFDSAAHNSGRIRSAMRYPDSVPSILWLVDQGDGAGIEPRLLSAGGAGHWRLEPLDGPTMGLRHAGTGDRLTVVFGRQIRTAEDLEVLVVGTRAPAVSSLPLQETVEFWVEEDVLVMLPWGFGKWTGSRGRTIVRAYERFSPQGLRLADTGAHSRYRRVPPVFARSLADGYPILAGSDPFPFPDQVGAIGRTGFVLDHVPAEPDWSDLLTAVRSLKGQPTRFGGPLGSREFVSLQAKMQFRKRLGGRGDG